MASFGTLAHILSFGLIDSPEEKAKKAALAQRKRGGTAAEREANSAANAQITQDVLGKSAGGRERPPDAPITGKATTREAYKEKNTTPDAPPSTAGLASSNMLTVYAAGERARKRASAGGSVLTKAQAGLPGPGGSYAPKTLLGS